MLSNEVNLATSASQKCIDHADQPTTTNSHRSTPLLTFTVHCIHEKSYRYQYFDHDSVDSNISSPQSRAFTLQHTLVNEHQQNYGSRTPETQEMLLSLLIRHKCNLEINTFPINHDENLLGERTDSYQKNGHERVASWQKKLWRIFQKMHAEREAMKLSNQPIKKCNGRSRQLLLYKQNHLFLRAWMLLRPLICNIMFQEIAPLSHTSVQ